jgi:hypothetical protein
MGKQASPKPGDAFGLVLTLGGAPQTPHTVEGLLGLYRPDRPTPVGGLLEPTLEQAKAADKNPDCPVELVELDPKHVTVLREQAHHDRRVNAGHTNPDEE